MTEFQHVPDAISAKRAEFPTAPCLRCGWPYERPSTRTHTVARSNGISLRGAEQRVRQDGHFLRLKQGNNAEARQARSRPAEPLEALCQDAGDHSPPF